MRIAILGAGAIGGLFGGWLAQAGNDVTLLGGRQASVDTINSAGLRIEELSGATQTIPVRATTDSAAVGLVDLVLVCVKCYHTEAALTDARPLLGPDTTVLTLQNGWGNAPRIAALVGDERVLAGLTYQSATLLEPGHIRHTGHGMTFLGELNGQPSARLAQIAATFTKAGIETTSTGDIITQIWAKLAVNACTLPVSALLGFRAGQLLEHGSTRDLVRVLLREVIAVAHAQGIPLDEQERWAAITSLLERAATAKPSMLQDIERRRRTEIDVINGAVVAAGQRLGIATPTHAALVQLVEALEATFKG